jgi:hypothetical protein
MRCLTGGPDVSRHPRTLRRIVIQSEEPRALLPHGLESRAWVSYSHGADATEPLTPLSRSRFILTPLSPSRELQPGRTFFSSKGWYGSEDVETA